MKLRLLISWLGVHSAQVVLARKREAGLSELEKDLTDHRCIGDERGSVTKECVQPLEAAKGQETGSALEPPEGNLAKWTHSTLGTPILDF